MLDFQKPNTTLTLEAGLREYYASREGLIRGRGDSTVATEFFRCHDIAHVVFGCSTQLGEEAVVKIWSIFGTTAGFGVLRGYALKESKEIYEELVMWDVIVTTLRSLVLIPNVILRCASMHKRWPWDCFDEYLNQPLIEIRQEFGIVPVNQ